MTIKSKEKQIKFFVFFGFILALTVFTGISFLDYKSKKEILKGKIDDQQFILDKKLQAEKNLKRDIEKIKEKREKNIAKGLDSLKIKRELEAIMAQIKIINLRVSDVSYHIHYSNLLDITLELPYEMNAVNEVANRFTAKRILNLESIKKALNLYGDYRFDGNRIYFQYYKQVVE